MFFFSYLSTSNEMTSLRCWQAELIVHYIAAFIFPFPLLVQRIKVRDLAIWIQSMSRGLRELSYNMKGLLLSLVVFLLPVLIRGEFPDCETTFLEPGQTYCTDNTDGKQHEMDSTWTNSQCYKCHCSATGMTCCDTIVPPNNPNPQLCTVEFDYETCQATVVSRDDPSLPC
ncbi:beta-microseminoprotein-like [Hemibagrus wyckioides]|uniref:beta-microseminoprotein-like n=1 Tax=Hemibagrus wyckioides TaxID=337641 RepID=UPI00266DCDFE|nr:beta-microseminoprotein-like [Hemibagrus wyckioides]